MLFLLEKSSNQIDVKLLPHAGVHQGGHGVVGGERRHRDAN